MRLGNPRFPKSKPNPICVGGCRRFRVSGDDGLEHGLGRIREDWGGLLKRHDI